MNLKTMIYLIIMSRWFIDAFIPLHILKTPRNINKMNSHKIIHLSVATFKPLTTPSNKKHPIVISGSSGPQAPKCFNCKHYMPNKNHTGFYYDEYGSGVGLCKMFGNRHDLIRYSFAKHCRENENQCGKYGYLYEENEYDLNNILCLQKEDGEYEDDDNKSIEITQEEKMNEKKDEIEDDLEWVQLKYEFPEIYEYSKFLRRSQPDEL